MIHSVKLLVIASFEMRTFWVLISTVVQQLGCSLAQWVSRQPHATVAQVSIQPVGLCYMSSPIKAKMAKNMMSAYNSPSLVVHRRWIHKGMYIVSNNIQVDRHVEAVWPLSCDLWHQQHILTRSLAIFSFVLILGEACEMVM